MRRPPPRRSAAALARGTGSLPAPRCPAAFFLFLVAGGVLSLSGHAGAQRLNIRHYSHAQGLPQAQIYAIHQDARGYIWVGSNAGLARYDGRRFLSITAADGLTSNSVVKIDQFPSGTMVAAIEGGVCFLRDGSILCLGQEEGVVTGQIRDMHLDADGGVWVAADRGISLVRETGVVRSFGVEDGLPRPEVLALARDEEGTLWAGTRGGLARLDGTTWTEVPLAGARGRQVAALRLGPQGMLVGTGEGLLLKRGGSFEEIPLADGPHLIRNLAVAPDGAVWAESPGMLFRYLGGESVRYTPEHGIPAQAIWSLLVDREGNVWMGSDNGLDKLVPGPFALYTGLQGLPHPFVRAATMSSDGRVWLGTRDGLALWQGNGMTEVPFRGLVADARIYSLGPEPRGGILAGTPGGLVHRSPSGTLRSYGTAEGLPHPFVFAIVPDGQGGVWLGTNGGVARWKDGAILPPPHPALQGITVRSLARDDGNRLWVGLQSGGVLVLEGDSVRSIGSAEGLSAQTIWSLAPDGEGGLWAGTNGDGAYRISQEGIRRVTSGEGLGDNFVWQVLVDRRGDVWMFTGMGLNRLSREGMRYFGTGEGLQDLEGAASAILEDSQGDLWFGTASGVYRYQPGLDKAPSPPTGLFLEAVTLEGRPVSPDLLELPPNPRALAFRFSTPTYRDEEGVRFRYRLAGEEEAWSEPMREPTVSFARLGPGRYTLEVSAETYLGPQSPRPMTVPFSVRAAFWQQPWVYLGLLLLVAAGFARVPAMRARRLERERQRLETLVGERTREIQSQNQRLEREIADREAAERAREVAEAQLRQAQKMEAVGRLAGGIAHDFNNLLTTVLGYADLLAADAPRGSELREDLEEIRHSAQKGAGLVSQLLAFSRKQAVQWEALDLAATVRESAEIMGRALGERVRLKVEAPHTPLQVQGDPDQIGQILLNLALNARDAMEGGGACRVAVERRNLGDALPGAFSDTVPPGRYILLSVSDTGKGMDEATLAKVFEPFFTTKPVGQGSGLGLPSVHGIVHQHQGFIQIASEPGAGTTVEIYLPEAAS